MATLSHFFFAHAASEPVIMIDLIANQHANETTRLAASLVALLALCNPTLGQKGTGLPLNPAVSQETIGTTICVHGWTKTVRPPVSHTSGIKKRMMSDFGIPSEGENDITLDHRIPLALGGSPDDINNLMLQPDDESKDKDRVEVCLARSVCVGKIKLTEAQIAIWQNWKTAGKLCAGYRVVP